MIDFLISQGWSYGAVRRLTLRQLSAVLDAARARLLAQAEGAKRGV